MASQARIPSISFELTDQKPGSVRYAIGKLEKFRIVEGQDVPAAEEGRHQGQLAQDLAEVSLGPRIVVIPARVAVAEAAVAAHPARIVLDPDEGELAVVRRVGQRIGRRAGAVGRRASSSAATRPEQDHEFVVSSSHRLIVSRSVSRLTAHRSRLTAHGSRLTASNNCCAFSNDGAISSAFSTSRRAATLSPAWFHAYASWYSASALSTGSSATTAARSRAA